MNRKYKQNRFYLSKWRKLNSSSTSSSNSSSSSSSTSSGSDTDSICNSFASETVSDHQDANLLIGNGYECNKLQFNYRQSKF